jgi:hypothetical protein
MQTASLPNRRSPRPLECAIVARREVGYGSGVKMPQVWRNDEGGINPVALTDVPKESPMQLRCEKCGHQQDTLIGRRH